MLIDGGLPRSAPVIAENLATLGFRLEVVRLGSLAIAALPCDILLAPHPYVFHLDAKLERLTQQTPGETNENPFIDPGACRAYAAAASKALDRRIAKERAGAL